MKLSDQDGQAVDTVLNAAETYPATAAPFGGVDLARRVTKVDAMLKLLDYLPADDPSPTLVEQTMRRVEQAPRADDALPAAAGGEAVRTATGESLHLSPSPGGEETPGGA